jgi:hypothetical protein
MAAFLPCASREHRVAVGFRLAGNRALAHAVLIDVWGFAFFSARRSSSSHARACLPTLAPQLPPRESHLPAWRRRIHRASRHLIRSGR